jgi:hypothetical protein
MRQDGRHEKRLVLDGAGSSNIAEAADDDALAAAVSLRPEGSEGTAGSAMGFPLRLVQRGKKPTIS